MGPGILIVEDDPSIAAVLLRVLQRLGMTVECVGTGLEAMTRLGSGGITLVILDLGLPDIDGNEVCRTARAQGFAGKILVVSARYGADVAPTALNAGADGFISKPFAVADLESRARTLLA